MSVHRSFRTARFCGLSAFAAAALSACSATNAGPTSPSADGRLDLAYFGPSTAMPTISPPSVTTVPVQ